VKRFADLYTALDQTTSTNAKVQAMADYFADAPPEDAAWAVYFLSGERPRRLLGSGKLREWAAETAKLPAWLFEESYSTVGDLAETIALLLPEPDETVDLPLHVWVEQRLLPLRGLDESAQREAVVGWWMELDRSQRFVWNKLITSGFRVGVSKKLLVRALAEHSGVDADAIMHRLMGNWEPSPDLLPRLLAEDTEDADISRPYPFCLAHPIIEPDSLGPADRWIAEWKWDGIRAQLIRRRGQTFIWSRGGELVTERYPEVAEAAASLSDGLVLDGELLAWRDGSVLPFGQLQRRIGKKSVGKKLLREVPVVFLAFDCVEHEGSDVRPRPFEERRRILDDMLNHLPSGFPIRSSEIISMDSWGSLAEVRKESRERLVEGMMLKGRDTAYAVGRKTGIWWKWKIDPFTIDAVLIYAQGGSGRRATLFTDYTFAVWDGDTLVPFAKAYSGLTDLEIREVDRFVRRNTIERFGPVRSVTPELVFEIAFEGIQRSSRHKSGIAVRFPRMARWRRDKKPEDADTLDVLRELLPSLP
jgi:DNA ligase 1